jgi:hypothetical protein
MAMSDAERAKRYRDRKAGRDVPRRDPGPQPGHGGRPRKPVDHASEALSAISTAAHHLGWVHSLAQLENAAPVPVLVRIELERIRNRSNELLSDKFVTGEEVDHG